MAKVEMTDTFAGETNYSWVNRFEFNHEGMSDLAIVRKAKALAGWNGLKCKREVLGETIKLTPYGICQVMFID